MKKILTIILDGFGMREDRYGNAIKNAGMTNFINLWNNYPHCLLKASEEYIGLPEGQPGYSELGHTIIGAGRSITNKYRDAQENIDQEKLRNNEKYTEMISYLKKHPENNLHIITLISDGGITSHINFLLELIQIIKKESITNTIYIDAISDGVDTSRKKVLEYLEKLNDVLDDQTKISTLCGRYYALCTDNNYKKTKIYYDALFKGDGVSASNLKNIINTCYINKITDEYIPPIKTKDYSPIMNDDIIFFADYNKFSHKQLFNALTDPIFDRFELYRLSNNVFSLYEINKELNKNYFYEPKPLKNTLTSYLSALGLTQAKIMESIKKDSMIYCLDGFTEKEYKDCDVYVLDTPKTERADKKPEMNCLSVAKATIKCMEKDYDFITVNFANPDIVGKTGNYQATVNSLQAIDVCLGKIIEVAQDNFYKIIIVGSHGKADTIINRENEIVTKNTLSPVPFIITDKKVKLKNGSIKSVAPTILKYLDIAPPKEMKETELLFDNE